MSYHVTVNDDLTFEPPGPGTWMLIDGHFPRPLSRYYCTIDGEPMEEGYNQAAARFGGLIERETAVINRFYYMAQQPIDQHNPGVVDGVSFDERVDRLRETYEQRAWHQTVNQWDEEWKPSVREAGRELIEVDPASLTDEALIDHLDICRSITWDAHVFHFRVLPPMGLAVGDFLAHAADLTGRPEGGTFEASGW